MAESTKNGPHDFMPRVTKFVWGREGIIVANDSVPEWPSQGYKLIYDDAEEEWTILPLSSSSGRLAGVSLLDWRADPDIFGKQYVLWRGESSRGFIAKDATIARGTSIWVNGVSRTSPGSASVYGGCLFRPTAGLLEGQTQVIVVTPDGATGFFVHRTPLADFVSGSFTWVQLTGAFSFGGSPIGAIRSVFFAQDGTKGAWIDPNGDTPGRLNTSYVVEITISADGSSISSSAQTLGPFSITTRLTGDRLENYNVVLAFPTVCPDDFGDFYIGGRLWDTQYRVNCDVNVPVGVDYIDSVLSYCYLRVYIDTTSYLALEDAYNGDLGTPSANPTTTGEIFGSSYTETLTSGTRVESAFTKKGVMYDVIVGPYSFGPVAYAEYDTDKTGVSTRTRYVQFVSRDSECDVLPPDTPPYQWAGADLTGGSDATNTIWEGTETNRHEYMIGPVFVDIRYGVACISVEERQTYDVLVGTRTLNKPVIRAYDSNGEHVMRQPSADIGQALYPQEFGNTAPLFGLSDLVAETGSGLDVQSSYDLEYDSALSIGVPVVVPPEPADTAIAHFNGGMVVILLNADGDPSGRTFLSGSAGQNVPTDMPNIDLSSGVMSWATPK